MLKYNFTSVTIYHLENLVTKLFFNTFVNIDVLDKILVQNFLRSPRDIDRSLLVQRA